MIDGFFKSAAGRMVIRYRRALIVISQIALVGAAYVLATLLCNDFHVPQSQRRMFSQGLLLVVAVKLLVFYYYDLYRGWWRYVGMADLIDIVKALTVSSFLIALGMAFFYQLPLGARSVLIVDWFVSLAFIGGARFGLRAMREQRREPASQGAARNVLIYGAQEIAVGLLREMRSRPELRLNPVGFIDDYAPKKGFKIMGVPILGSSDELPQIIGSRLIDEIIVAQADFRPRELSQLVAKLKGVQVRIKVVPALTDIIQERVRVKHLREVDIEDLLGRERVEMNEERVRSILYRKRILITGAGGSIGSELARQVANHGPQSIMLYERGENDLFYIDMELRTAVPNIPIKAMIGDITDRRHFERTLASYRPELVLHAAAYKHVPMMELHPLEAIKNNVLGTRNVIEACIAAGVEKCVLISTDKAVRPRNVMGMTKRVAELTMLGYGGRSTRFFAVRFGNVLDSAGSVVPLFRRQIEVGGPVTVTHPQATRYFMTIPESVSLVLEAASMGRGGEVYILEMGEPVRIIDLARNMIRLSGYEPDQDIEIKITGLRRGEKLHEELFTDEERVKPTWNRKIMVVTGETRVGDEFLAKLQQLEQIVSDEETEAALALLTEISSGEPEAAPDELPDENATPPDVEG
ncbi:MAG: nucleoside-diphosphate sugar epimerase/dehydratase [Candidatus Alcyoniella australis]|nr:nucleoside-diphosphate sugar epimerase/dehydratase [Candidatus Alcyoniella australis]